MKSILLSFLKFVLLFVPAYLAIGWFVPETKAQIAADGLVQFAWEALRTGVLVGALFTGGIWLTDKFVNKKRNTSEDKEKT